MGAAPPAFVHDHCENAIRVLQYLIAPEPQHQPAVIPEMSIAFLVCFAFRVLPAIGFDSDPQICTGKIEDIRGHWVLAPEMPA